MPNINTRGLGDKINMDKFRDTCNEALKDRCSVRPGKGQRWRTLNNDTFRKNFDEIFNHKPKKESNSENK